MYGLIEQLTKEKMKRIFATLAILAGFTLSSNAQKAIPLVSFADNTDSISVMETAIWKITPLTGDTTSLVEYYWNGQKDKLVVGTEDSLLTTFGSRFLETSATGLSVDINVDYIESVDAITDSTCTFTYNEGRLRKKYSLAISIGDFIALINAL